MIVYGSGGGVAKLGDVGETTCPACGESSNLSAIVTYRYWHIWYILSFLVGRDYYVVCDKCENAAPISAAQAKQQFPRDTVPFIRKSGWLLVAIPVLFFVLVGAFGSWSSNKKMAAFLAEPQVNDIYLADMFKIPGSGFIPKPGFKNGYGAMKLVEMDDDLMIFATTLQASTHKSEVNKSLKNTGGVVYDMDELVELSKDEVAKLRGSGAIYEIRR